uniref:Phospholipid scramblase n=1 Tax=Panagrolaimus sp. ES5 TaxID=591445 RepID=A0AC34G708_9BILA
MTANVEAENGILISTFNGNAIMYVRPPNQTQNCIGKLMHPNPTATMFKIMQQSDPQKFLVHSISSNTPILKIEKLNNFKGKCFTILGADCVHSIKKMDNTVVGDIRPKLCCSSNTLIVQFKSTNIDAQIRAIILGIASLFAITEAYPEIGEMLSQTLQRHH